MNTERAGKRSFRLTLAACIAGAALLLALVAGMFLLNRSRSSEGTRLTDQDLRSFNAERISAEIAERGPVLFSDTAGGDQDFIVQHVGDDPLTGWRAFEARRADQHRECFFEWHEPDADAQHSEPGRLGEIVAGPGGTAASGSFVNTCDPGDSVDANGSGLAQYQVTVENGIVTIDIGKPLLEPQPDTARTPAPTQKNPARHRLWNHLSYRSGNRLRTVQTNCSDLLQECPRLSYRSWESPPNCSDEPFRPSPRVPKTAAAASRLWMGSAPRPQLSHRIR